MSILKEIYKYKKDFVKQKKKLLNLNDVIKLSEQYVHKGFIDNIKKNMGWCNDPKSKLYNKLIKIPFNYSYERIFRKDNVYDIILVLNFNLNPILKNKGSAIFIHISRKDYQPTKGCIGLAKNKLWIRV